MRRQAIVVRRTHQIGGYRDGNRGEALVLDQIAVGPGGRRALALGAFASASAFAVGLGAHSPIVALVGLLGGAAAGAGIGHALDRRAERTVAKVRLVIDEREMTVFRPGDAPEPRERLAVAELGRIELVPMDVESEGWTLVAVMQSGSRARLLDTGDRTAGLRARTLMLERLIHLGAFEGEALASTPCPACGARIVAPEWWLPTSIACGRCGVEGHLARFPGT
jgi:hypothetical protein